MGIMEKKWGKRFYSFIPPPSSGPKIKIPINSLLRGGGLQTAGLHHGFTCRWLAYVDMQGYTGFGVYSHSMFTVVSME